MRRAGITALLALLCLAAPSTASAQLHYACLPAPSNCSSWYTQPVDLVWDWNNTQYMATAGNCGDQRFARDTPGTTVFCQITHRTTGMQLGIPVTIRVDQTPPAVTPAPARPPDHNGWFNHPVSVAFAGADATSGVASCTSAGYGGPDAAGVVLTGTCTDVAGNSGQASFGLSYDATPPAQPSVDARPSDNRVKLTWGTVADAEAIEVARVSGAGLPALLYRGLDPTFTDTGLRNDRRYRYQVVAVDRAGNRSAGDASAVPTDSALLSPARGARVRRPPLLIWEAVKRASYYNVQLYRGRRKILTRWPRRSRLQLTDSWRFGEGRRRLEAGRYTWYVFPGLGERSKQRFGRLLGESTFTVVR